MTALARTRSPFRTPASIRATLPPSAVGRLARVSAGWVLVAFAEAAAYVVLAWSIADHRGPWPVLVSAAIAIVITVLTSRSGYLTGARLAGDLYGGVGAAVERAKLSWFTESNRALLGAVAGRGIPMLMGVPAHALQTLILSPLIPILVVIGIGVVCGPAAFGVAAVALAAALAAQVLAQRRLAAADAGRHDADAEAARSAVEFVDHLDLLRAVVGPDRAADRLTQTWTQVEQTYARTIRASVPATAVSALASALPLAAITVYLAVGGFDDPAAALALIVLAARASTPLDALALIGLAVTDVRDLTESYRSVVQVPSLPAAAHSGITPADTSVALVGVRGAEHGDGDWDDDGNDDGDDDGDDDGADEQRGRLGGGPHGITATFAPGATVLVEGPTGSGKSTLLGLLMRFDDPRAGAVSIGGADLVDLDYGLVADLIAYAGQDPVVFTGTLADNIRLGAPDATDDDVLVAARQAQLGDLIDRDPAGLHQDVGTRGSALSGGERQRVGLARAFVKDAPILILDEPVAALDGVTESAVAEAVRAMSATVFVVTHRDGQIWGPTARITLG